MACFQVLLNVIREIPLIGLSSSGSNSQQSLYDCWLVDGGRVQQNLDYTQLQYFADNCMRLSTSAFGKWSAYLHDCSKTLLVEYINLYEDRRCFFQHINCCWYQCCSTGISLGWYQSKTLIRFFDAFERLPFPGNWRCQNQADAEV